MEQMLGWIILPVAVLSSAGLLLHRDWRFGVAFLALLYLAVFWLVQAHWPLSMAAVKLVTGWMICGLLALGGRNLDSQLSGATSLPQGRIFRVLNSGIVLVASYILALRISSWLNLALALTWTGLFLAGMGLYHLGTNLQPFRVTLGLLTVLAGFEILYAAVEKSILVAALLAVINIGIALAGIYFLPEKKESAR